MLKQLKHFTLHAIAGANIATIVLMLLVGYSDRINPAEHNYLAIVGLAFPIFLVLNMGFIILWVIFKPRGVLIPMLGYLVCYGPIRIYMPLNSDTKVPKGAIKVISYNVWSFAGWETPPGTDNAILSYLHDQKADILCLQESSGNELGQARVDAVLDTLYQYKDTACVGSSHSLTTYSKFPILSREHIRYPSVGNMSMAYQLKIGRDTVIVINNHLESTGFSAEEKEQFGTLVRGELKVDKAKSESRLIINKLAAASRKRAPQADAVARYVSKHNGRSIILCGDFNDSPISYTRHKIAENLTDCYVKTGNGPGISYHHSRFWVRIDNIMCSAHWQPYACKVDKSIKMSDHYPIICWLKRKP
ncbi:endonuclease/exonuclease/phosphatase family protein [Prevotella sp. A2931]|uniref:Endonuclease/exonuclease/phosphatase family protein n=1 Tax=Prevotella illustrans TaxID=2800387 RepID=A0ABS3M656_9BACT|nr:MULTISPECIES: endonuclease/exonuclease/phosphatase family protein [Prevotella]MBO1363664.1 endonuclease/exonuclease/phosphatase family protein [Prevotella illustrans]PTL26806.1 AP endonuclease [Prevotella sp. oral taxon 820]